MFDKEDREQNTLDYQYVSDLRKALASAISAADGWYDECHGGECPNLEKERALLKYDFQA